MNSVSPTSHWVCPQCKEENAKESQNCHLCETIQPGLNTESSPEQSVLPPAKKRSWLRIVIISVVILGGIAAARMWYETYQLDKLSKRLPGLKVQP